MFQHHVSRSLRRFQVRSPGSLPCWLQWFNVGSLVFILMLVQCSLVLALGSFFDFSLVLRPAGSITAFQHHVTRSLRWFSVCSPGSSPCWLDHCVPTPCDSITAKFHVGSPGPSPCWLDHCVLTPCDSITAAVPRWFSRFFALLARSLRFDTM